MILFKDFELDNGLRVIVHEDPTIRIAVINLLYQVGSRDEDENKTGFAHLFEHLMFGGSKNIRSYDEHLERVGGDNNAFTSTDITNYYLTVPSSNLETGFWLESDRMLGLSFDPKVLEVQRKVVIEEFKQRYLNQPYGDVWLILPPLAYKNHPYRWPTIGKEISHIEEATMEDVKEFFYKHYLPNNAVMIVAGDVKFEQVKKLSEKWFGSIPSGVNGIRKLPQEPRQIDRRFQETEGDVPVDALYKAYHMPGKFDNGFHTADLLSDILGLGKSSRLYQKLVREKEYFTSLGAYVTGSLDPGLLVISGKLNKGVSLEDGESEIDELIHQILKTGVTKQELVKVKNQAQSTIIFQEIEVLNRAMNLAFMSLSGDPDKVNTEIKEIQKVTRSDVFDIANTVLLPGNCSTLYYRSIKK